MHLEKIALVLEGGGMRAMFSAGVFEAFLAKDITFPYISSISAGSCNILSYMSKQSMRNLKIVEMFAEDRRYFGLWNWLTTGNIFGFDFIFKEIPSKYVPFDYEQFLRYPGRLQIGATDIRKGEGVWFDKEQIAKDFIQVRASASLPFLSTIAKVDGRELLDGGLISPIPLDKAMEAGYEKFVVVLTRNLGFRKNEKVPKWLVKTVYHNYPKLGRLLAARSDLYNQQLELVEELERQGRAVVIRPEKPMEIRRLDVKKDKLIALHEQGLECGLAAYDKMVELLHK